MVFFREASPVGGVFGRVVIRKGIAAGGTAVGKGGGGAGFPTGGTFNGGEEFSAFAAHSVVLFYLGAAKIAEEFRFSVCTGFCG